MNLLHIFDAQVTLIVNYLTVLWENKDYYTSGEMCHDSVKTKF